jgi:two-component system nitrate/nitrite response regulator NarL
MARIFLCDDADDYRALVTAVFEREADLEVVGEAPNAMACIADAPETEPDVVLLDLNMPGLNGLEAVPLVLEAVPGVSVVILTSADDANSEREALARGARAFIRKPMNAFDLPDSVRAAMAA